MEKTLERIRYARVSSSSRSLILLFIWSLLLVGAARAHDAPNGSSLKIVVTPPRGVSVTLVAPLTKGGD